MHRVWIMGASGSGKSTLARHLAHKLGADCVDLDELHWRPDWQEAPDSEFFASVETALTAPFWVVAGNYTRVQKRFLPLADTIIWLDYSFPIILWRQLKRVGRRVAFREPCCNGNYESLRRTLSRDSVILWFLRTHHIRRRSGWNVKRRARQSGIRILHFRTPRACDRWLEGFGQTKSDQ